MRVAFICNICLLLAWLSKDISFLPEGFIQSTVVILGVGLSIILNIILSLVLVFIRILRKKWPADFPGWLIMANFLFLIFQVYLLLK